jgi:hypothetical protein
MSELDGSLRETFAGDLRTFRLGVENIIALEDSLDMSLYELAEVLIGQFDPLTQERKCGPRARLRHIREPIRIGLIGAGCDGRIAERIVNETVREGHMDEHLSLAFAIVLAARVTPKGEVAKKKRSRRRPKQTVDLTPNAFTESQAQSASP